MASIDGPLSPDLMKAFGKSVEEHFSPVTQLMDSQLKCLSSSIYGFATQHAIVTIGIYHGHRPGLCVTLRRRADNELLAVDDTEDIGLANFVAFSDATTPTDLPPEHSWTKELLDGELQQLAEKLLRYGKPFMVDPLADWIGLRTWLDIKIKKNSEEMHQK